MGVAGYWSGTGYNRRYISGHCRSNKDNCDKYDNKTHNCLKCNWGYNLNKDQQQGHHCNIKWWLVLLYVMAGIVGFILFFGIICCICGACCGKGKKYRGSRSSSSSSSSSRSYSSGGSR